MVSDIKLIEIKQEILDIVKKNDDIISLYMPESVGELFTKNIVVKGEAQIDAILLQLKTKTKLTISLAIQASYSANMNSVYESLKIQFDELLKKEKLTLDRFEIKVLDVK